MKKYTRKYLKMYFSCFQEFDIFKKVDNRKYKSDIVYFIDKFQNGIKIRKFRHPLPVMKFKTDPAISKYLCIN